MLATLSIERTWDGGPADVSEHVRVTLHRVAGGLALDVDAPYHGDPPPPAKPGPCDRLWEHEVVELFLAGDGARDRVAYTEVELSPHGHYLVLRLLGVRNAVDFGLPLAVRAEIAGARWRGRAVVPLAYLPAGNLRANAYAAHGRGAGRRYLAAHAVPGPQPDFHQPERFAPLGFAVREASAPAVLD